MTYKNGDNGIKISIAFDTSTPLAYNSFKAATQFYWVISIYLKIIIGSMLFPWSLQVMWRCSPVLRPVLPVIPTVSPALTVWP